MQVWYMRPIYFRNGIMGFNFCSEHGFLPDPKALEKTHVLLKEIPDMDLNVAYEHMQGDVWSPNGSANSLIRSKGLEHTSLSVGDVIVKDGHAFVCDQIGWKELP